MRIAIFSDIHGNLDALESILNDIKKEKINEIVFLIKFYVIIITDI